MSTPDPPPSQPHPHIPVAVQRVSAVVPLYNEEENVPILVERLLGALGAAGYDFDIVLVDDGSRDGTARQILAAEARDHRVKGVFLSRNYGQSTAMQAGFDAAAGDIVVALDGDLQNDPADIRRLVDRLEETGADVVSGWRKDRQDPPVRKAFSRVANRLISRITRVQLHDFGCSLKAYRREVLQRARVLGEMHRFLAAIMAEVGGRVDEVPVTHHPRLHGRSKYGLDRTFRVLLDMLLVYFLRRYIQRPLHLFGYVGLAVLVPGLLAVGYLVLLKLATGADIGDRPLLLIGVMMVITGMTLIGQGLLGELLSRSMFEGGQRQHYFLAPRHRLDRMRRQLDAPAAGPAAAATTPPPPDAAA